jgi:hypothetical protein
MTQEKLEQRAFAAWKPVVGFPLTLIGAITLKQAGEMDDVVEREMVKFARAELEKAAEILDKWYNCGTDDELNQYELPSELIRKLME